MSLLWIRIVSPNKEKHSKKVGTPKLLVTSASTNLLQIAPIVVDSSIIVDGVGLVRVAVLCDEDVHVAVLLLDPPHHAAEAWRVDLWRFGDVWVYGLYGLLLWL